ncbi:MULTISPECIES: hypothetical protein [Gammaproteobacteria]|jgi:hypothetical protein|uniref:hypothetical protein n=3 Tax=Pseudomonadota TaxID=1224 RepID=UPI000948E80C|nr:MULTISPECIES: hypothetical protein [Gammaproteobacteria]MDC9602799.1 hypothetical protein [Pseudoalteromonas sp. GABNS16G]OLF82983.1 hypothetical protein AWH63_04435 [Marinobacter sp. C18]|tara:strand:+ start:19874 stop:20500 length:627 start_codon:yes stop_codon:yes gene_type:complete
MADDRHCKAIRKRLEKKAPGERLSLEEIRELKKIEAERVNERIRRGIRPEDQSQVWQQLFAEGRFLPANRRRATTRYLTGLTALDLDMQGRTAPGWHSTYLYLWENWTWSGDSIMDTTHLLGLRGVYDATSELRRHAPNTPESTHAASYERAVFDLLHHFAVLDKPVPNIQAHDIDHEVDFDLIRQWINESELLPLEIKSAMLAWLKA